MNVNDDNMEEAPATALLEEVVDLAECARRGEYAPPARGYKVTVRGQVVVIDHARPTGRRLLELAGFAAEEYTLHVKVVGERARKLDLDEEIDLCAFLIESFKALPRDTTEGQTA